MDFCTDGNVKSFALNFSPKPAGLRIVIFSIEKDSETYAHLDGINVLESKCMQIDHLFLLIFDELKQADIESYWSETLQESQLGHKLEDFCTFPLI
jgi:hypothetical protein